MQRNHKEAIFFRRLLTDLMGPNHFGLSAHYESERPHVKIDERADEAVLPERAG
jgi:hypothetical protein